MTSTSHLQRMEKESIRKLHISRSSFPSRRGSKNETRRESESITDAGGGMTGMTIQANVSVLPFLRREEKRTLATNRSGFSMTPTHRGGVLLTRVKPDIVSFYAIRLRFFRSGSFVGKAGSLAKITFNTILNKLILRVSRTWKIAEREALSFPWFPKDETWLWEFLDDSWSMRSSSLRQWDLSRGLKSARNSLSITSLSLDSKDFART